MPGIVGQTGGVISAANGLAASKDKQALQAQSTGGVNGGGAGTSKDGIAQQKAIDKIIAATGKDATPDAISTKPEPQGAKPEPQGAKPEPQGAKPEPKGTGGISQSPETQKTLKFEKTILKSSGSKDDAIAQIDSALKNGALPKGMRDSLEGFKGVVSGSQFNLNLSQKNALSTLKANPGVQPLTPENIQSKINDKKTSPELKQALERVRDDPALMMALDTGDKRNGGGVKADGNISQGDISQLALQQKV